MSRRWKAAVGASLAVVLLGWLIHDYRLSHTAQARILNQGKTWEHKTRIDAKGVEQVWAPAGCFEMGSDPLEDWRARADETPRHTVCISAGFWLDRYEVTNENYQQFIKEGAYLQRRYWSEEGWRMHDGRREPYEPMLAAFAGARQPRVKLTWYEAEAYATWRGGRLPTEAEWEWAARGPESVRYPWGNEFHDGLAKWNHPDVRRTQPVGSYPGGRSWCGAEDMAGNVLEWVADGYDPDAYRHAPRVDPFTPPSGMMRAIRGGAWGGDLGGGPAELRSACRASWKANNRKNAHGVRVVHPGP